MIKKNKGEWSELYAFYYLAGEGEIFAADSNLEKIENNFFPILKLIRNEGNGEVDYFCGDDVEIIKASDGAILACVPQEDFKKQAKVLYEVITTVEADDHATFSAPEAEAFMERTFMENVSASPSAKADLTMQIHDVFTGFEPVYGWSVKSELGSPSTLLNAGRTTNFVFRVSGLSESDAEEINAIKTSTKIIDRFNEIVRRGGSLKFEGMSNKVFERNLRLIDTRFPEIVACALQAYYSGRASTCKDAITILEEEDPLGLGSGMYVYKFKKFLTAVALGMRPSDYWDGRDEAKGGYIVVTRTGDVLAYHVYNRDMFEDYLFENTKFERGSSTRHSFASIYEEAGELYINMNLQVRFKKRRQRKQ